MGRKRLNTGVFGNDDFEDQMLRFRSEVEGKKRSTCLNNEVRRTMELYNDSVLGMVHLELAKYHEICRFTGITTIWIHFEGKQPATKFGMNFDFLFLPNHYGRHPSRPFLELVF